MTVEEYALAERKSLKELFNKKYVWIERKFLEDLLKLIDELLKIHDELKRRKQNGNNGNTYI